LCRYREVCTGKTGHVEVCQVKYDPSKCTYEDLCMQFYTFHDPTTMNRQAGLPLCFSLSPPTTGPVVIHRSSLTMVHVIYINR
jgi:hypothetical protein